MNSSAPIVMVYLNNYLPKYAIKNLGYLQQTFPEKKLIVLLSEEKYIKGNYGLKNIKFIVPLELQTDLEEIASLTSHPSDFRKNFWNVTIARFIALEKFMLEYKVDSLFHFEADVLVAPYFPFAKLENIKNKIAYPAVSPSSAAASIFYVSGVINIGKMNEYFKSSLKENPHKTDMTLLSDFSREHNEYYHSLYGGMNPNTAQSKRIFDAATFGIYLTGDDPRNGKGWTTFFTNIQDHTVKPSEFQYSITSENVLLAKYKDMNFEIQNLHIHSKNKKYFTGSWPSRKLISQIGKSKTVKRSEFSLEAFYFLAKGYLIRRLLRMLRM